MLNMFIAFATDKKTNAAKSHSQTNSVWGDYNHPWVDFYRISLMPIPARAQSPLRLSHLVNDLLGLVLVQRPTCELL